MSADGNDQRMMKASELEGIRRTLIQHFSDNLYHRVGIREICRSARVSPKTVYKYFGSKEELLLGCIHPEMEELTAQARCEAAAAESDMDALLALGRLQLEFYAERPAIARIVFLNIPIAFWMQRRSPAQAAFQELLHTTVSRCLRGIGIEAEASVQLIRDMASGAVHRMIVRWLLEGAQDDLVRRGEGLRELIPAVVGA